MIYHWKYHELWMILFRWAWFKTANWQVLANCLSISLVVDVTLFLSALCFAFLSQRDKLVVRKLKHEYMWLNETYFLVLMEQLWKESHHQSILMRTWRLDPIATHHLWPEATVQPMDWKPKFSTMSQRNGFKQTITRSQTVIGMSKKRFIRIDFLWSEWPSYKQFRP